MILNYIIAHLIITIKMMFTIAPTENEEIYVNRKNYHSINVQLMCESDMRIANAVIKYPGNVHDSP